jgi:23S rRNA (cytosine1962-C5)-methyltransferase
VNQIKSEHSRRSELDYELIDFGAGRKLERMGTWILDRVSPAAAGTQCHAACDWSQAHTRLDAKGRIIAGQAPPQGWECCVGQIAFKLRLTPFGHVGLFPEQAPNWLWLGSSARSLTQASHASLKALNLFAYTGGTTMALARAGVQVVHVDASAPAVTWARDNAAQNGLAQYPIRWIVEDARKFVRRELRRGQRYHIIVLDPPSYGHGAGGQRWSIVDDLPSLLQACIDLLAEPRAALLLTAHSDSLRQTELAQWIAEHSTLNCEYGRLGLTTSQGKTLDAGCFIRGLR